MTAFVHDGSGPDVDPVTGDEAETMPNDPLAAFEALAETWETVPKPAHGWDSGLSATEAGNRLGAWNVLQQRARELRAAIAAARSEAAPTADLVPWKCPKCGNTATVNLGALGALGAVKCTCGHASRADRPS